MQARPQSRNILSRSAGSGYGGRRAPAKESFVPARLDAIDWKILDELQRDSAPFGTKIQIEGDVGIIRP